MAAIHSERSLFFLTFTYNFTVTTVFSIASLSFLPHSSLVSYLLLYQGMNWRRSRPFQSLVKKRSVTKAPAPNTAAEGALKQKEPESEAEMERRPRFFLTKTLPG